MLGERLGPYLIEAAIVEGGMGAVYRARDTRLDRTVAVKVSKQQFSERFEREARAVAALNHPNICTLHDVGPNYLVMEYVEGKPLKGPLPIAEVQRIGAQIGDALAEAHRRGITHRDLKPANILLTAQGNVKIIDFGLAKSSPIKNSSDPNATLTKPLTNEGTILGTLCYMSPEQLHGEEADARSDIFSFGCVLHELATGKRAFSGQSQVAIMAAILEHEPPSTEPAWLDRLIKRCLRKKPDERWQSAADIAMELRDPPAQSAATPAKNGKWKYIAAALAIATVGAGYWGWSKKPAPPAKIQFKIASPDSTDLLSYPEVSPDGSMVAFRISHQGTYQCAVQYLDRGELVRLPESTSITGHCMWSPDSKWLAYALIDKLVKIQPTGGKPVEIAPLKLGGAPFGGWSHRGILLAVSGGITLFPPDAGETPKAIIFVDRAKGVSASFPRFLPDGKRFLFCSQTQIRLGSVDEPGPPSGPSYGDCELATKITQMQDGSTRALFRRGEALMSQPVDPVTLSPLGEATVEAPSVELAGLAFAASLSPKDVLAYRPVISRAAFLTWYTRTGEVTGRLKEETAYFSVELSPDGKFALTTNGELSRPQLSSIDLARDLRTPIGPSGGAYARAVWAPDNDRFVYSGPTFQSTRSELLQQRLSRGEAGEPLEGIPPGSAPQSWSPDGRLLLYLSATDLWLYDFEAKKSRLFAGGPGFQTSGQFSRDGKWIAFTDAEQTRIVVQNVDSGQRWQVAEGSQPRWGANDREIFFFSPSRELSVAPFSKDGPGTPKALFRIQSMLTNTNAYPYDIHPDGRILVAAPADGAARFPPINVIVNAMTGRR
ncbi:MAG: hypothetical protein FJW38_21980 [Acidobacteria bacterium]|nr:hypothetical protein [Acidobacteriota bacterium]